MSRIKEEAKQTTPPSFVALESVATAFGFYLKEGFMIPEAIATVPRAAGKCKRGTIKELSDEMAAALKGGNPWKKFNGIAIKSLGLREDVAVAWQQLLSCQMREESGTLLMTFVDPTVDYGGKGIEQSRQNGRRTSRPPASFRPPPIFGPPATGVVPIM